MIQLLRGSNPILEFRLKGANVFFNQRVKKSRIKPTEQNIVDAIELINDAIAPAETKLAKELKRLIKPYNLTVKIGDELLIWRKNIPHDVYTEQLIKFLSDKEDLERFKKLNEKSIQDIIVVCNRINPSNGKIIRNLLEGKKK